MQKTIELIVMIASVMMTCVILISVYGFRRERGVKYLLGVIGCRIVYSSGVILEKSSFEIAEKLIFRNLHQTALNFMVPFFLLFTLELIGRDKFLSLRWKLVLFLAFGLWSSLMWLDPVLHMTYRSIELSDGHLVTAKTMYSITFSMVCYCTIGVCFYFLFQYIRNIRRDLRQPIMLVLFFASFSVAFEIVRFANPLWSPWLLSLSVYCGFIGMIMLAIVLRYKFFSIVPFARTMVLDTLQESIVIANASGVVIDHNKRASDWFSNIGHAAVSGRPIGELLERWPSWLALCESMEQGSVEIEARPGGVRRIYSVNVYPLHTQRKRRQGVISLIFDITEKQQHLERIAQLSRLKDQLVAIVSHDIRSPLALQSQLVELLEEDRTRFEPDHREIIELLSHHTRNTLGMTTNLLAWFRSQREDMALHPMTLELSEVVEESRHAVSVQGEMKRIRVRNSVAEGTRVFADREALGLILRNLLSNALKYTGVGGDIDVSAERSGDLVTVAVRDNGVGMREEQVRLLSDESELGSLPGTLGEQGTGLGLIVSRQFVRESGGTLWAESKWGEGSVFYFTVKGGPPDEGHDRRR
jgi:signal transduction histidine kinase